MLVRKWHTGKTNSTGSTNRLADQQADLKQSEEDLAKAELPLRRLMRP